MIGSISTAIVLFIFLSYLLPHVFVTWFFKTKNLKKSYNANWALVTGSSSGKTGHKASWVAPSLTQHQQPGTVLYWQRP